MCGIAGMVGEKASAETVIRMSRAMAHRGPDGSGVWSSQGVALGHRRLAIIDLTDAASQPMHSCDGRYTLVYNGEVYNYCELRARLGKSSWRSNSDTEVVLRAFERWGPSCFEMFHGMWALALWDRDERRLYLSRDRLGIKPLYYARLQDTFLFGSEIRTLLAAGVPAEANNPVIAEFLARDFYEHSEETFFSGIRKLPAASWAVVDAGGNIAGTQCYWSLGSALVEVPNSPLEREERLLELASSAVGKHLRSDVPVGIALSGGLDSSLLLSLVDKCHTEPRSVEGFTFCFPHTEYSEWPWVERMAQETGRRAHACVITPESFAAQAPLTVLEQEEPHAGLPIAAYSEVYRRARQQGYVVMMDGSGIDEALGGYARFAPALWADLEAAGDAAGLQREWNAVGICSAETAEKARHQMSAAANPVGDVGMGQDLTRGVRPQCITPDLAHELPPLPNFHRPFTDHLRNLMYRELIYTKLPRALRFRDRLSMACGTELRPPFLDHTLLEYCFSLPAEDRIYNGEHKAILRRAARRLLPDAVRLASKRSVQTPQREWFRGVLADWVRENIDNREFWQQGWVDRKEGVAHLEAFMRGEGDNSFFLWQWINLAHWARTFLVGADPDRWCA
jgi:asparagine synthase (glutamine-hydrolysing)